MSGCATLFGGELKQSLGIGRLLSFTAVAYAVAALVLMVGIKMVFPADFSRNQPPVPAT
jgi:hypothetical protein